MIVGYTKLHGHSEKAFTSFEITYETFLVFLGMLLLSGCHKLLQCKMCWDAPLDTFVLSIWVSVLRDTFECILWNLHVCDEEQLDK